MATEATNQATTEETKAPVTFTPEQQEVFNAALREAQGRAGREHKERADKFERELSELRASQGAPPKKEPEGEPAKQSNNEPDWKAENKRIQREYNNEIALAKKAAEEAAKKSEALEEAMKKRDKNDAIRSAIDSLDVELANRNAVMSLTDSSISWDEERKCFVVLDQKGNVRFNSALNPMGLDEFYKQYLAENPYLVKASVRSGAGSKETSAGAPGKVKVEDIFGPNSNSKIANELAKTNIAEYRRLRQVAKEQGLV